MDHVLLYKVIRFIQFGQRGFHWNKTGNLAPTREKDSFLKFERQVVKSSKNNVSLGKNFNNVQ